MPDLAIRLAPHYHTLHPGTDRLYCMNYANTTGELAVTRFTYTRNHNDLAFYQDITGGRSSRNVHKFDKQGRIIRKDRTYNDGETSVEQFTYDTKGHLTGESFKDSKGINGQTEYAYNELDQAVRMTCQNHKGWFTGVIEFSIDNAGRRISGQVQQEGATIGEIQYTYEPSGNLVKEHWEFKDGWSQSFQFVYEGC